MRYLAVLLAVLGVALGVFFVVYGEQDDSPGGQLIGVAIAVGALVYGVRSLRRSPR